MFTVLHSSAGAGKTHALVKHYLGHALHGDDPGGYRRVLALTFTTKAAGEMKERVMSYLERLARNERGSAQIDDVFQYLGGHSDDDRAKLADRAGAVLSHMLHHWNDVAISTIDSFTRRVVRPFARDLQLDHDLRMTTEQDHYRQRAVDTLLAEVGKDPVVTSLLTAACLQLLHEERPWDAAKPLFDLSNELLKEGSIIPLEKLRTIHAEDVLDLARELRKRQATFQRQVNALGDEALALLKQAGITAEDMANGGGGIHGYFVQMATFDHEWKAPGPNKLKPMETGKWHGSKATAATIQAINALSGDLTRIFGTGEELRNTSYRHFVIRRAVSRELLTAYTLHELGLRLEQMKQADGVAFFSDLTRKVAQVVRDEPAPFIHERMGERYLHFLLDEFQDTSMLQWIALLPLIENALGSGGTALLVGDAKQAIYRWRNGEVRLFTHFPKLFGRDPEDGLAAQREASLTKHFKRSVPLAGNWRSADTIVQFNNALFGPLADKLSPDLRSVYEGHDQHPSKGGQGLVRLEIRPADPKGEERAEAIYSFVDRCIQEALADGFVPGDIAVLVRGGWLGREIPRHLVTQGHAVMSPDGLRLSGDPAIELIIDVLRFLHTGDPTAAARALQYECLLHADADSSTVQAFGPGEALPRVEQVMRDRLRANGSPRLRTTLTALIGDLARVYGLRPSEDAQLLALLDEVQVWTVEHGQDIGGFLEHWERSGGQKVISPPEHGGAIQVMTIHKAKGLQFPVVIVPDTDMSGGNNQPDRLWIDPGDAVPELPVALVRATKDLQEQGLAEVSDEIDLKELDEVNLLYVAFTRPEQRLYAQLPGKGHRHLQVVLREYVETHGQDHALNVGERTGPWTSRTSKATNTIREVMSGDALAGLTLRREAPEDWDPAAPDPRRAHGNAVHEVLAGVTYTDDLQPGLDNAMAAGLLDKHDVARLAEQLVPLLGSPALKPWYGTGLHVRNEATIIAADGTAYRPDRVVIEGGTARVLDIKTGGRSQGHHDQVRTYMQLLLELGHDRVEGALLYLADGALEPVTP